MTGATFCGKVKVGYAWPVQGARVLRTMPEMGGRHAMMAYWPRRTTMKITVSQSLGRKMSGLEVRAVDAFRVRCRRMILFGFEK